MGGSDFRLDAQLPVQQVDALIESAAVHDLGLDFLLNGALDAVAATFRVHAFVVDAARDRLREQGRRATVMGTAGMATA